MKAKARMPQKYIVFGQPRLTEEEISAVAETLRTGWIGTGPKSMEFEQAFATYQGVPYAAAVSSCTAALTLALQAYGIGSGDEVITTAMTFAATVNAIIHVGATPVLADIERDSLLIDLDQVESLITPKTRAIVPVHFAGAPVDIDWLLRLRQKYGIKIIHDCAHAIETRWKGKRLGSFADAACYSFYSTKNITSIEGGMICSGDEVFIRRVKQMSNHGMSKDAWKRFSSSGYKHYDVVNAGFKFNFTDVQAALGLAQLQSIDKRYAKRSKIWIEFQKAFSKQPLELPHEIDNEHLHAKHLYTILVDKKSCGLERDEMLMDLHELGIGCGIHYRSIPEMTYFNKKHGWRPEDFPNAHRVGQQTLSLPLTPYLRAEEVERVIASVKKVTAGISAEPRAAAPRHNGKTRK